jgi:hypothetical protein
MKRIFGLILFILFSVLILQFANMYGSVKTADITMFHIIPLVVLVCGKMTGAYIFLRIDVASR